MGILRKIEWVQMGSANGVGPSKKPVNEGIKLKKHPLNRPYNRFFRAKKSNIEIKWQEQIDILFRATYGT